MASGGLGTSFPVIEALVQTAFVRSVVKTIVRGLGKTVMRMSFHSYSMSLGLWSGSQRQNNRAMLVDFHLSTARSGVKVLVAGCLVSSLRKE